jgi:YbgC/YbaW family acyl-CoA thioester hydrolase
MFSHISHFRVEWGETDTAGIIFYPNYYRWFDRATHELFRAAGMPISELIKQGYAHPILETGSRFLQPLFYDDAVTLETTIVELKTKTFKLEHKVRRGDQLIAEGFEVRAWVKQPEPGTDGKMSAVAIPEEYASRLRNEE